MRNSNDLYKTSATTGNFYVVFFKKNNTYKKLIVRRNENEIEAFATRRAQGMGAEMAGIQTLPEYNASPLFVDAKAGQF